MDLDPLNVVPHLDVPAPRPARAVSVPRVEEMGRRGGPDPAAGRIELLVGWIGAHYGRLVAGLVVLPFVTFAGWTFSEIGSGQHAVLEGLTRLAMILLGLHLALGIALWIHRGLRKSRSGRVEREARLAARDRDPQACEAIQRAYRPVVDHEFAGAGRTLAVTGWAYLCAVNGAAAFLSIPWFVSAIGEQDLEALGAFLVCAAAVALEFYLVARLRRALREARVFLRWALEAARRAVPAASPIATVASRAPTFRPYGWQGGVDAAAPPR